jgi:hypothetical protein
MIELSAFGFSCNTMFNMVLQLNANADSSKSNIPCEQHFACKVTTICWSVYISLPRCPKRRSLSAQRSAFKSTPPAGAASLLGQSCPEGARRACARRRPTRPRWARATRSRRVRAGSACACEEIRAEPADTSRTARWASRRPCARLDVNDGRSRQANKRT